MEFSLKIPLYSGTNNWNCLKIIEIDLNSIFIYGRIRCWSNSKFYQYEALDDSAKKDLRSFRSFWPFVILLPGHEFNFSYAADWMDQFLSPR